MSFEIAIISSPSLSFSSSSSLSSLDAPHMESSSCSERETSTASLSLSPSGWNMSPHQWSQEEGHKMFPPSALSLGRHASSPCASTSHSFTLQPPSQSTSTLLYAPSPFPHNTLSPSHTISSHSPHMTSSQFHTSPPCMTLHLQSPQPIHTSTSPHLMPQPPTTMISHIHTIPPLEMDTSHQTFMLPVSSSSFHTHSSMHETSTITSIMATTVQSINEMISHDISSPQHNDTPPIRRRRKSRNHAISSSLEALEAAKHSTSPAFSSAQLIIPGTSVIAVPPTNGTISNKPKKFQCPECGKGFTQKGGLINHSRIHAGERPYKCDYPGCERSFVQKCNRTRHYRVHTGEKPFECHLCSRRFNRKWGLITHIKSHEDATIMEMPAPSHSSTSDTEISSPPHHIIHTSPTVETSSISSIPCTKRITRSRKRKNKIENIHHDMISHESMSMSSLSSVIPHPIPLSMSQSAPSLCTSSTYDTPMPPLELFTPMKHEH